MGTLNVLGHGTGVGILVVISGLVVQHVTDSLSHV